MRTTRPTSSDLREVIDSAMTGARPPRRPRRGRAGAGSARCAPAGARRYSRRAASRRASPSPSPVPGVGRRRRPPGPRQRARRPPGHRHPSRRSPDVPPGWWGMPGHRAWPSASRRSSPTASWSPTRVSSRRTRPRGAGPAHGWITPATSSDPVGRRVAPRRSSIPRACSQAHADRLGMDRRGRLRRASAATRRAPARRGAPTIVPGCATSIGRRHRAAVATRPGDVRHLNEVHPAARRRHRVRRECQHARRQVVRSNSTGLRAASRRCRSTISRTWCATTSGCVHALIRRRAGATSSTTAGLVKTVVPWARSWPTDVATTSHDVCGFPSRSQTSATSRPWTTTGSPLCREAATWRASRFHTLTVCQDVVPFTHSPSR